MSKLCNYMYFHYIATIPWRKLYHVCVDLGTHKMLITHELHVYTINTKLAKSTALNNLVIKMEACSCKLSVTKLASIPHTLLQQPQPCSL